ncbi:MAG: hypothetical protein Q8R98_15255 [Rubrivivax sp.]|nr:hypothetical protein [Rubrivivax sp.]MDP3613213.1 hypothetical protein [Rubrivivax sp.]
MSRVKWGVAAWFAGCLLALGASAPALAQQASCAVRTATLQGSYSGDCAGGLASGRGRAAGVDRYEGEFRDGQPHGRGVYQFADGRRFEGQFEAGRVNGQARFSYPNGDVLEGEFRLDQLRGQGRFVQRSGGVLIVEMKNGALVSLGAVPSSPPAPAPQAAAPARPPATAATPAPMLGDAAGAQWQPRMDFEDVFPSFILAASTRKPIAPAQRSAAPRGDPLALQSGVDQLMGAKALAHAGPVRSRYTGGQTDAFYLGDPWGLVGARVRSTQPNTQVTLRVSIDEIAEVTEESFTLPQPGMYALYPKIRYRFERLRNVNQPLPINVNWSVSINGQPAGQSTQTVRLRSVYDAPFQLRTERGLENMSWVFAAYVTEDAPWIDEWLREAFAGQAQGPVGYQMGADHVDKQVETVFMFLRKKGVKYSSITATSGISDTVSSQVVRFPSDSIRTAQANCIDGTVLLASLLRKMGIEPFIVTGPGHAIVGYLRETDLDKPDAIRILETTMIGGDKPFSAALSAGAGTFNEWSEKAKDHPMFKVVMVASMRRQGVLPIAR